MIVDIFTHILPAAFTGTLERTGSRFGLIKRLMEVRELHDLDLRFRAMDGIGEYRQIVALPNPPIEAFADPRQGADLARVANDGMAELVAKYPDRFPGFIAALSMNDMDASMRELERAIGKLGACGVQVFTNVNGKPLDAPEFQPLFAAMAAHDLPSSARASRCGGASAGPMTPPWRWRGWFFPASSTAIPGSTSLPTISAE
jgi:predicted TIM-barrel fold metal-dependent hydrolase